jgi:hypothetical protein
VFLTDEVYAVLLFLHIITEYAAVISMQDNLTACQDTCTYDNGCDFVLYFTDTKRCHHKWTDKEAYSGLQFRGESRGAPDPSSDVARLATAHFAG